MWNTSLQSEIDDALIKTPASEVLIEKFHIQITRRDIATLDGLNWLNDEVIVLLAVCECVIYL